MKKILASILPLLFLSMPLVSVFWAASETSDSSSKVDHFEVSTNQDNVKIWEAIDLTVKAVDKSWNVKKDYLWIIYITVDNDTKATIPYSDGYQFVASDLWQKTFSKGLSFTKEWKMKVSVLDIDNDQLEWSTDVNVSAWSASTGSSSKGDLVITSPDNWVTVPDWTVKVSWTTKKNSKVQFYLNWSMLKDLETQSDDSWNFLVEMKNLTQQNNLIQVKVLDWNDKTIAESDKISVTVEQTNPLYKSISVKEWTEVPMWSEVNIEVLADAWLPEITASIWDSSQTLTESKTTPGTYEWKLTLPSAAWDYPVNLTLKDKLWKTTNKASAVVIKAIESNIFKNVKTVVWDKRITFTFEVTEDKPEYAKFKFKYGTSQETLKTAWDTQTKESTTFEKEKIKAEWQNTYTWYIPGLEPAEKYFFQILPIDKDWKEMFWMTSDIIEVAYGWMTSAWACMISNVSGLNASQNGDVVELSWDSLPEAASYNVYKKDESGQFVLIENVKANKYTLNISWDKLKYDEFSVKAVCGDWETKNESQDFSNVTKVQTWPAQIAILLLLSLIIAFFIIRKRTVR